ncbi:MAG: hypothetical protein ABIH71_05340, partial [Candidatus Omnitrophota bacterium]
MKKLLKNMLIVGMVMGLFFLCGEIGFRAFFPEYRNHIFSSNLTLGKKMKYTSIYGIDVRSRTLQDNLKINSDDNIILVFGDSVTAGYGLAYEDIFWNYWQRMLDLEGRNVKIVSIAGFGNNFSNGFDNITKITNWFHENNFKIGGIIYQFNFNDLIPYTSKDIKYFKHLRSKSCIISKIIIFTNSIRVKFLYRSVMIRVICNKLTRLFYHRGSVSCGGLGVDALGEYTYSFGAENFEILSNKIWDEFENRLMRVRADFDNIPFVLLITPIAEFIDPDEVIYTLSRPRRFDCATIKPIDKLESICRELEVILVNPIEYMRKYFNNYVIEGNPARFYHINDDNHLNEIGAKYFAEYSYRKIFI